MKKVLLHSVVLINIIGGLVSETFVYANNEPICTHAHDSIRDICSRSNFYQTLTDEEKHLVDYLVEDQPNTTLALCMHTISMLEKALAMNSTNHTSSAGLEIITKLSMLTRLVREQLQEIIKETRVTHTGILTPIFHCCTPKDAYFREVVANLLMVTGDGTIAGNLSVGGSLVLTGSTDSLVILGDQFIGGTLTVSGSTTLTSLTATGGTNLGQTTISNLNVINNESVGGNLSVTGNELINGTLTVTGSTTLSSLTATGGTNLGQTTISNLNVINNESVGGNLSVTGNELISGTLTVTGSTTLSSLTVTGSTSLNTLTLGTLTVSNLSVSGNESIGGNVAIGGTLTVTGSSTLNNSLGITGNISQPALAITAGAGQNAIQTSAGTVSAPAIGSVTSPSTGLYFPAPNQFALTAGGINEVQFDGNSVLVSSTYRVEALPTVNQPLGALSTTTINFGTQTIGGAASGYNSGTSTFTAPVTGVYLVGVVVTATTNLAGDVLIINVVRSGTTVYSMVLNLPLLTSAFSTSGTWLMALTAGQTLIVQAVTGGLLPLSTPTIIASPATSLAIHLLSAP